MTDFVLPVELVQRLERTAQQENLTPAELVERLLNEHLDEEDHTGYATLADFAEEAPPGTLAALAQAALRANISSDRPVDTSERSREILNTEFADYIRRNMGQDENEPTD